MPFHSYLRAFITLFNHLEGDYCVNIYNEETFLQYFLNIMKRSLHNI